MPATNSRDPKGEAERVALYLRVGLPVQREEGTIETQRQYLERYIALRGSRAPAHLGRQALMGALDQAGT
jgi:hypothetical protein